MGQSCSPEACWQHVEGKPPQRHLQRRLSRPKRRQRLRQPQRRRPHLRPPRRRQQPGQIEQRVKDKMPELKDEMADVGILLFELAHNLGVDLGQAMLDKIERNESRYPVAKARGSNAKYNEL
jgi:hypothetical protein